MTHAGFRSWGHALFAVYPDATGERLAPHGKTPCESGCGDVKPTLPNLTQGLTPPDMRLALRDYLSRKCAQSRPRSEKQIETISRAYLLTHEILAGGCNG